MRSLTTLLIALSSMTVMACAGMPDASDDGSGLGFAEFNLEADDGGFDPDDPDLSAFEADDPEAFEEEGPSLDEPGVDVEIAAMDPDRVRYEVRLVWGQRNLTPNTPPTDWSGAVSTNVGAIRVRRTIRFEPFDEILERTSPQSVEFTSRTTVHNDGLRFSLIAPRNPSIDVVPSLTIALGDQVATTIPHSALRHLIRAKRVDDLGNGVAMVAWKATPCPKGGVAGHWAKTGEKGGRFGGKVLSSDGEIAGRIAGLWGTRANGKRRFYGLFIQNGMPAGLVRGTWKSLPNKDGGMFRGHFVTREREHAGVIRGFYKHADETSGGRFLGLWAEKGCDADASEPPVAVTDASVADADLCSADGLCVAEPQMECSAGDCTDTTDE